MKKLSVFEDTSHIDVAIKATTLPWWSLRRGAWLTTAGNTIRTLWEEGAKLNNKVKQQSVDLTKALRKLNDSESVNYRIEIAFNELERSKGRGISSVEDAYVLVLSPYQYEQISNQGSNDVPAAMRKAIGPAAYAGMIIVTAKGFYGPAVMTEDAFNAFSRNAPELQIQRKMK